MELQWRDGRAAISDIADHRAAEQRAMHPHLMGAAGTRPELEPGAAVGGAQHAIIGDRRLAGRVDYHVPADTPRLLAESGLDAAFGLSRHAGDNRPIDLFDLPFREQPAEAAQCL